MLVLYTSLGCHLCEEAKILLNRVGIIQEQGYQETDISDSDELTSLYGIRVPVIKNQRNGDELSWPFNEQELRNWLK